MVRQGVYNMPTNGKNLEYKYTMVTNVQSEGTREV